jgi:hypothetical protein
MPIRSLLTEPNPSRHASAYRGIPGDPISVVAGNDFQLAGVTVKITDADGILVEQGACVPNLTAGNYVFTSTVEVSNVAGTTITAKATNTPGHTAGLSVTL